MEHAAPRQQDVKQTWRVWLNQKELGKLVLDENDTVVYFAVPPGGMSDGDNTLLIEAASQRPTIFGLVRSCSIRAR